MTAKGARDMGCLSLRLFYASTLRLPLLAKLPAASRPGSRMSRLISGASVTEWRGDAGAASGAAGGECRRGLLGFASE